MDSKELDDRFAVLRRTLASQIRNKDLVEDLTQTAFVSCLVYKKRKGTIPTVNSVVNIGRNALRSWLRAAYARDRRLKALSGSSERRVDADPAETLERLELSDIVRTALIALPHADRELIRLHYWEGWTVAEIAERQARPFNTIKTQLRRAMARMRKLLVAYATL